MSIPKVIHYCWFGDRPLPKSALRCIMSWKKHCPEFKIVEWNESNFDVNCNAYCADMFARKKWAFLTDYIRLKVVYEYGGVYLDTDVRLLKSINPLLDAGAYMGVENTSRVATGLGFAAPAGHSFIRENMQYYEQMVNFEELQSCPIITTNLLKKHGYDESLREIQEVAGLRIYPEEYLCPKNERTGLTRITRNSYSVHQFDASWFEKSWKKGQRKRWREARIHWLFHLPNQLVMRIIGKKKYLELKKIFGRQGGEL